MRSPRRAFYDGLAGGLSIGFILGVLAMAYFLADAFPQFVGPDFVNEVTLLWIVLIVLVVGTAYDAHKVVSP